MDQMINLINGRENLDMFFEYYFYDWIWNDLKRKLGDLLYTEIIKKINDNLLPEEINKARRSW